jgi:hypothetical protein
MKAAIMMNTPQSTPPSCWCTVTPALMELAS